MHGNLLSSLPSNLGQLTSLRTLQLVGNHLQALPESISALTQLTDLGLAGNQLTAAPAALGNLSELAADGIPCSSQAQRCVAVSSHATGFLPQSIPAACLPLEQAWTSCSALCSQTEHTKARASCTPGSASPRMLQAISSAVQATSKHTATHCNSTARQMNCLTIG